MCEGETVEFTFVCPECTESLDVDGEMKDALVNRGCVVCGTSPSPDAFRRIECPESV